MPVPSTSADPHRAPRTSRWLEVGRSVDPDARRAGRSATRAALAADDAKLLVVFCSGAYDLDELLAGITACAPGVPLIG